MLCYKAAITFNTSSLSCLLKGLPRLHIMLLGGYIKNGDSQLFPRFNFRFSIIGKMEVSLKNKSTHR